MSVAGASARPELASAARPALAAIALAFAALLLPLAVAAVPPLWDYPNHLARLWLLSGGAAIPPLDDWYRVTWDTLTNIGMDLGGMLAVHVIGLQATGRLIVTLAVILPPLGGAALWRALHGRLPGPVAAWPLAFTLLAWSTTLIGGFLNFQLAIGLALLSAAADPALARRGPAIAFVARTVLGAVLLLVHAFGLVFYAVLMGALAVGGHFAALRPAALRRTVLRVVLAGLPLALVAACFLLLAPKLPGTQVGAGAGSLWYDVKDGFYWLERFPGEKLGNLVITLRAYNNWADALAGLLLLLPVAVSAALGRLRVHAGLLVAALVLAGAFLVTPPKLAGTYYIDVRFSSMLAFVAVAAVAPALPVRLGQICMALLLAGSLSRTGTIAWMWHARQADVQSVARALEAAEPGRRLLPLANRPRLLAAEPPGRAAATGGQSFDHLAALALPWRHDFVPTLFAARGKQPIEVRPAMAALADPEGGGMASPFALVDPAELKVSLDNAPYLTGWQSKFDYVLLLNADQPDRHGAPLPPSLVLLRDAGFARLYRITREGGS